jgi:hypothetical protein
MSSDKEEDQNAEERHKPEEIVAKLRQVDVPVIARPVSGRGHPRH